MLLNQLHIERCPQIEHHNGRHVPERQFIVQPETPVDGNVEEEVKIVARLEVETLQVVDGRDDQPRRKDTQ